MKRKKNLRWNTMRILVLGFLGVIFLGAVLLWLPVCNEKPISFLDALFTSTTSVCVTGLITIVPRYQFTVIGKLVLLLLIQIGGLGVIACVTAFFILMKRKVRLKERIVIQETYNMNSLGGMVGMVRKILIGTLVVESAGAVLYAIQFIPEYGVLKGIWYGIFHSISAFCNAGIDILGTDSLAKYITNPLVNITTMLLITLGGLGFVVWYDVIDNGKRIFRHEIPRRWWFTRLTLHSKIVLTTSLVLFLAGTVLTFVLEYNNPATIGNLNIGQKILASAFQSVTTRTAGFFTFAQEGMHEETGFLHTIFMLIGGSPGGTAGGLKTTTFAMLFLAFFAMLRGGHDIECFGRKFAVFGLGSFGESVAIELQKLGCEVIAVDKNMDRVEHIADSVSYAMQADIGEADFIRSLGVRNLDGVVITVAENLEASIMATMVCREIGVPYIVAKTKNERHATVLEKIGADSVIYPDKEMGIKLARNLMSVNFTDWISLSPDYSIMELLVPKQWVGKSLKELNVRNSYGLNVVGIKKNSQVEVNPDPDEKLSQDMVMILVGANKDLKKI